MVMRSGVLTESVPQPRGVLVVEFWGGGVDVVAFIDVEFPIGGRVVGLMGKSSLLHKSVLQHLEEQLAMTCPWPIIDRFFALQK